MTWQRSTSWMPRSSQRFCEGYQIRAMRAGRGRLFTWQAIEDRNRTVRAEWRAEESANMVIGVFNFFGSLGLTLKKRHSVVV